MPVAFDTLKAAKRLQDEAGFSEKQAGVLVSTLAEGVGENLATKADVDAIRTATKADIESVRSEMQAEFKAVRSEMQVIRTEMQASDERTQAGFAAMRSEFQAIRSEMQARDAGTDAREQRLKLHLGAMVASATVIVLASVGIVTAIILTAG